MQILRFRLALSCLLSLLTVIGLVPATQSETAIPGSNQSIVSLPLKRGSPWLFAGFEIDSKDGVYYAISLDGAIGSSATPVSRQFLLPGQTN